MLGFVGDVGSLAKLTMAADGSRNISKFEEKLGHEMADCLWSLLVLAKEYEVDLEKELLQLTEELEKKLIGSVPSV
jgi:NTP pyrophosphatase (non-canonical NTP hydrolase)